MDNSLKKSFMVSIRTPVLRILKPLMFLISFVMQGSIDQIHKFYISVNNSLVHSSGCKYSPESVLMLLPRCLQNSGCGQKVTSDINNCVNCGRCCIGDIRRISNEFGINAVVVTGGTAARNIAKKIKPDIILSVACERDLASGIADMGKILSIGVLNERPNGPCVDTTVDVAKLSMELKRILLSAEG